jgi:hypothetical protein
MSVDRQSAVSNRNVITEEILARAGIDEVMIEALVRAFYERGRRGRCRRPKMRKAHDGRQAAA